MSVVDHWKHDTLDGLTVLQFLLALPADILAGYLAWDERVFFVVGVGSGLAAGCAVVGCYEGDLDWQADGQAVWELTGRWSEVRVGYDLLGRVGWRWSRCVASFCYGGRSVTVRN